ncbi:M20/M25/M40 family metallo-hydrolase [Nocardia sp. NPDC052112]|uniref:M20/M25/M40 family metallo-hydrolase n=1 Tax=Nocardia sp. NPDC052112 TaxID=3155646 RepID=UPI00342A3653
MTAAAIYAELDSGATQVADQVVQWRHQLHRHPELSNRESNTAAFITDHLRSLNLDEVRTGIAGHGIAAVLRGGMGGDRMIALRADIDALPVRDLSGVDFASKVVDNDYPGGPFPVSHACGHDCHTAMLIGAASVPTGVRDQLPGTALFVFQPAEEGPPVGEEGGAKQMLAEGAPAQAYNCSATAEYRQDVPAVHNTEEWITAALPTFQRVAGADKVIPTIPTLGYDDVSELVDKFGGRYVTLGVQDSGVDPKTGMPVPIPGGRGMAMNHNPHFCADDGPLLTGVRLHAHVAYDHLSGLLVPK